MDETALSAEQKNVLDSIASGPRGAVAGPLRVWVQSPGLAEHAQALGRYVRFDSVLPPHLSELAILVTARYWSSNFEWAHHVPIALRAGIPQEAIDAISRAEWFEFADPSMQSVFEFAAELQCGKQVKDATYDAASKALGLQGCVDLVGLCGYYTLISMTINVFDVPKGDGPGLSALDIPAADYFRPNSV